MKLRLSGLVRVLATILFSTLALVSAVPLNADSAPSVEGSVSDPSGAVIQHARVEAVENGRAVAHGQTDSQGRYSLTLPRAGAYGLRVTAPAFRASEKPFTVRQSAIAKEDVVLKLDLLSQQVTVTATGMPTLRKDSGSAVTILTAGQFEHTLGVDTPLRLVPGAQITQTGQPGGLNSLYIRGGDSDAGKVLVDGVGMNGIGGAIDLSTIASSGIEKMEVLGGPNSAIYGVDAMSGVVSLSTPRGTTPFPQISYLADGGNFGTYRQEGTLSGARRPFDYFANYSDFLTSNDILRDQFHLGSLNSDIGWAIDPATDLRATIHHYRGAAGNPNALLLYGIPDNTRQSNEDTFAGIAFNNQTTPRWHNTAQYGLVRLRSLFTDFSPTGIPQYSDGSLIGYLGAPVTIHGANGYTVSGQAQYQYVEQYPSYFASSTDRDSFLGRSDLRVNPHLALLFGFKYADERGYSDSVSESINRSIYDTIMQAAGDVFGRLHYIVGADLEENGLFGFAAAPRASLAYDLPDWDGNRTKLRASFGKGIKEPALEDQETSLYTLLSALPNGPQLNAQYHIPQIGAEYSRSFDGGIDQSFERDHAKLSITLFHSQYTSGIEYVPQQGLTLLGVPEPVVASAPFGATLNSQAFRAQGAEVSMDQQLGKHWFLRGGYTYLDAVVQHSFTSDAIGPSFNPNFPNVPIGAFSPLDGARPFRRAPHTGYFSSIYNGSRLSAQLTGTLVGRRDDSDFLSEDANYLTTLLLPNRNLDGAYQRIDFMTSYAVRKRVTVFASAQNLLSEHYSEAFGYPALPLTFRSGLQITLGGDRWKWK